MSLNPKWNYIYVEQHGKELSVDPSTTPPDTVLISPLPGLTPLGEELLSGKVFANLIPSAVMHIYRSKPMVDPRGGEFRPYWEEDRPYYLNGYRYSVGADTGRRPGVTDLSDAANASAVRVCLQNGISVVAKPPRIDPRPDLPSTHWHVHRHIDIMERIALIHQSEEHALA